MAETMLNQQEPKVESSTETKRQKSHLKRIVGAVLSVVMIIMTIYVLNLQHQNYNIMSQSTVVALNSSERATANYRTYVEKYKETKVELDETTRKLQEVNNQLDQVTEELATTKGMLTQTQGMLVQAQEENAKLKQQLQGLDTLRATTNVQNMAELEDKIKSLKDRDSQVSSELVQLKDQLRSFQTDFSTTDEGRSMIVLFQNKIRSVKMRMHYLKAQAYMAKVAAQKERDRLAALNGNSGFVIRDGKLQKPDGTKQSFAINVQIMQ